MLTKTQKKIIQVARRHGGQYHLPRRYPKSRWGWGAKDDLDRLYDDCAVLVGKRIAEWWRGPSIRLNYRYQ